MSCMKWVPHKLDELGFVGRGRSRNRPRNDPSLYGGPYPFFQTGDIKAAGLYLRQYTQTYNEKGLAQSKLWEPGTLCITIAANIAETAILGVPGCFPDSVVGFIVNPDKSDVRFIKYYIDFIKARMQNVSQGTTQDNLSLNKLLSFDFLTPPVKTQRKIAAVLSAYDDLIENNTRRIAILEEMARRLYREWFVHFRFPGYEDVEMVEVEGFGRVPQDWEIVPVTKAVEFNPRIVVPTEGEKPYLLMDGLLANSMLIDTNALQKKTGNSGSKFKNGDTLLARITPSLENGKTGFVQFLPTDEDFALGSTEFIVMRSKTLIPEYVYLLARVDSFRGNAVKSMIGASGRQRVQMSCFDNYLIVHPDKHTLLEFANVVRPFFKLIHILAKKNTVLRQTRDLLLPPLISELSRKNIMINSPERKPLQITPR